MQKALPITYVSSTKQVNLNYFFGYIELRVLHIPTVKIFSDELMSFPEVEAARLGFEVFEPTLVLFSEEIKFLIKMGYEFELLIGHRFKKEKVFASFINHFYFLKKYYLNDYIKYYSKIILNSLYGKFAAKHNPNNLIQISAGIVGHAKVEIYQYRLIHFVYSDTDSIILFKELHKKYLGSDIGLLKLVNFIKQGYFYKNYYSYTTIDKKTHLKAKGIIKKVNPEVTTEIFKFKLAMISKKFIPLSFEFKE